MKKSAQNINEPDGKKLDQSADVLFSNTFAAQLSRLFDQLSTGKTSSIDSKG